jgi:hypothetical protein
MLDQDERRARAVHGAAPLGGPRGVLIPDAGGMALGFATRDPVNVWLVRRGIEEAM